MSDLAVIKATFCDFRIVKGRKQAQLVFELPLEMAQDAITKLGMPKPSDPSWCAIALLDLSAPEPEPDTSRSDRAKEHYRQTDEMDRARIRAVAMCKDEKFQDWLTAKQRRGRNRAGLDMEAVTVDGLKRELAIDSRREIGVDPVIYRAFLALETSYRQAIGLAAEVR